VKRIVYMPRPDRLTASLLRSRSVVRGGLSVAIVLVLILLGVISFLWMVGFQPVSHDKLRVDHGNLSYNHSSAHGTNPGANLGAVSDCISSGKMLILTVSSS
jgi:hypothetical protein